MQGLNKYKKGKTIDFPSRTWPSNQIDKAPVWCSVDLRDGNQALIEPMVVEEKLEMFELLLNLGFKEIEVGFPSSSQIEFDFLRQLVDRKMIPDDVCIQVLCQCREHLIKRTFEAIKGIKKVIIHIYNSTSALQRDVVFSKSRDEIKEIALNAVDLIKKHMTEYDGELILEYSPESFTDTELDFALEVCNEVVEKFGIDKNKKIIINLPATVELTTPNVYADQIEWMNKHLKNRENIILSVHPHNDRGTGIAAAELALLAGADRVEGTLFGNGERTGNVDILTLAYNMFSKGIDPKLNLENIRKIIEVTNRCTKINISPRHPYAGDLVFTAFSGSHQDAINKGLKAMKDRKSTVWEVPYLPIDPADIGREYEPIVRINSQSGKGGVAFILDTFYGFKLPKGMHKEFANIIQTISEIKGEISPEEIFIEFKKEYLEKDIPLKFKKLSITETELSEDEFATNINLVYKSADIDKEVSGSGNGPIDAIKHAIEKEENINIQILDYTEHALGSGSSAKAASYISLLDKSSGKTSYGVGISANITRASARAVFSAINRLFN